ncbi:MAG: peptidoglycan-associated lipoprotein, partial [Burkholderiaceae bacterium]
MNGVKTLVSIIAFTLLGACSTVKLNDKATPVEDRNSASSAPAPAPAPAPSSGSTSEVSPSSATAVDPLNDPSNILYKRSVYFDYDQYTVKEEFRALVEAHGKYLAANP